MLGIVTYKKILFFSYIYTYCSGLIDFGTQNCWESLEILFEQRTSNTWLPWLVTPARDGLDPKFRPIFHCLLSYTRRFAAEFFWSLRYRIMSSANKGILTVSLPICVPFIPSSCLIALARNSRTMLNRSGERGHPCFPPDFRGNGFSFSLLSMMLVIVCHI
jgi:hypothetical protein